MGIARQNKIICTLLLMTILLSSLFFCLSNVVFAENEIRITYKSGDLLVAEDIIDYKNLTQNYTVKEALFTKDGYKQVGWSVNSDGSTNDFNFNDIYALDENLVLYPIWSKYNFTFNNLNYFINTTNQEFIDLKITTDILAPSIRYVSSAPDVVYVDNLGRAYPMKKGSAKITAIETTTNSTCECEVIVVDFSIFDDQLFKVQVDNEKTYYYLASQTNTVKDVVEGLKIYLDIQNAFTIVNENISLNSTLDLLGEDLKINFKYPVKILSGKASFDVDKTEASIGEKVSLNNISYPVGVVLGRISVVAENGNEVIINQTEKYFIMPSSKVEVCINLKSSIYKTNIGDVIIEGQIGSNPNISITKENVTENSYSQFSIPNNSQIACQYTVSGNIINLKDNIKVSIDIPKEIEGKDGIIVGMMVNGIYEEKQVTIENNKLSFETDHLVNFVILTKKHEKVKNLTGVIISFCYLNMLAFVGIIILTMKYIDNKQNPQKYKKKTYSSILPVAFLISAVKTSQVVGVVLLALLLLIQIIVLIILIIKLTEEGGLFTTSKDYREIKD